MSIPPPQPQLKLHLGQQETKCDPLHRNIIMRNCKGLFKSLLSHGRNN